MKVLIYCSLLNLGGGVRLLSRLASSIAQIASIEQVTVLIEGGAAHLRYLQPDDSLKLKVQVIAPIVIEKALNQPIPIRGVSAFQSYAQRKLLPRLLDRRREKLLQRLMRDYDLMYAFWPHQQRFYDTGKPVVCTYQDTTFLDFPEILGGKLAFVEIENAQSWVENAHLVVSSKAVRDKLVGYFGDKASKATVIYHNILPESVSLDDDKDDLLRQKLGLPQHYLLYPANINVHKNHDTLLKAWARCDQRQDMPLVLIGEGIQVLDKSWSLSRNTYWRYDYLYGLVRRLGLKIGTEVIPLGYVSNDELHALMRGATALIMPSYAEGGGSYPVEEALTYGIPVLCSDIPVMREHLSARSALVGWFDPYSPDAILAAIKHLLENYELYRLSAWNGQNDERPTWDEIANQYVHAFESAIHTGA